MNREAIFQKLQRAHQKVSKLSVKLALSRDTDKKEIRRKLRLARIKVETASVEWNIANYGGAALEFFVTGGTGGS